jgi:hypothetical protein
LRRGIPAVLAFCACAALAAVPGLAAERRFSETDRSAAVRETEGPRPLPAAPGRGFTVKAATPEKGIEGQVKGSGTFISFKSRKTDGEITSTILDAQGAVLYEYREFHHETIRFQAQDGSWVELDRTPELRVKGVLYGPSTPEQLEALNSLATSREGRLIRRLGLELFLAAPGRELVDERRGLELAAQALWPHFPPGGTFAPPLTVDYEVGPQGYLVLTQPEDLVLATNRASVEHLGEKHDDNKVNGCFGRCGEGCTGGFLGIQIWPSHWTDIYGSTFVYQQERRCVSGVDWVYTWYATPTTHFVDGYWTPGCQAHDNCCRLNPILCFTVCNYLVPSTAADILYDPLGEFRTWTYTDYSWNIQQSYVGYSGCTCPGMPPYSEDYECVQ